MPYVTVIVPAYNAAATLARTLQSVQDQAFGDFEVFVVDDGSTDATAAIAEGFAARDPRFTVLRQQNAGVAAARNNGLARASGQYVSWLDADDIWHPAKLERQIRVFERSPEPLSFVYTGYRLIDGDDRVIPNFRTLTDISGHTICRQIATNFFSNVSSIMVPVHLARRFGGHDSRLREWGIQGAEDLLLQLRLASIGAAGCCAEALVGYRMHHENMSLDNARAARSNLKALDLIEGSGADVPEWVFKLGRARTAGYCLHLLRDGRPVAALQLLLTLLSRQPGYTLLVLALIAHWQYRKLRDPGLNADPETGRLFYNADPATAPWFGHMVLSPWHERALVQADWDRMNTARAHAVSAGPAPASTIAQPGGGGLPLRG